MMPSAPAQTAVRTIEAEVARVLHPVEQQQAPRLRGGIEHLPEIRVDEFHNFCDNALMCLAVREPVERIARHVADPDARIPGDARDPAELPVDRALGQVEALDAPGVRRELLEDRVDSVDARHFMSLTSAFLKTLFILAGMPIMGFGSESLR